MKGYFFIDQREEPSLMLAYPLFVLNVLLVLLNTMVCSVGICICAVFKLVLPIQGLKNQVTRVTNKIMWLWATINMGILGLTNRVEWDIQGGEDLQPHGWYLLISNHLSWTDIVVLCCVFKDRIPMPKFFLKQQLLYVPFLGMACWALDMPFMRRYSPAYLLRHPEKRGQDLATTRRSCEKFQHHPTTVVNYVEGTRFTPAKNTATRSPYRHLLAPKTGGIAYTLAAMGDQFEKVIDVTLAYPDNIEQPFQDMLMGKMKRIVINIRTIPVDDSLLGDYFNDKPYKRQFQKWLGHVWHDKDALLDRIYGQEK